LAPENWAEVPVFRRALFERSGGSRAHNLPNGRAESRNYALR
jgi:hypothetical protein